MSLPKMWLFVAASSARSAVIGGARQLAPPYEIRSRSDGPPRVRILPERHFTASANLVRPNRCSYAEPLAFQRVRDLVKDRGIVDRCWHGPRLAVSDRL